MKTLNKIAIAGTLVAGLSACDLTIGSEPLTCNDELVTTAVKEIAMNYYQSNAINASDFTDNLDQYDVRAPMQVMKDETTNTFVCNATFEVIDVAEYFGGGVKRIVYQVVDGEEDFTVEVRGL